MISRKRFLPVPDIEVAAVNNAVPVHRRRAYAELRRRAQEFSTLIGCKTSISRACETAKRIKTTDVNTARSSLLRVTILEKWRYHALPMNIAHAATERLGADGVHECEGDRRLDIIERALAYLERHGFRRSKHQRIFHRAFLIASIESFYHTTLHQHLPRLLRKYGIRELRGDCAITTPRRWGKTWAVAMWAGTLLVTQPSHDTCIYSVAARTSKSMLKLVISISKILSKSRDFGGGRIVKINQNEEVSYETADGKYVNAVYAFPAKAETLRGQGSKCKTGSTILEEASFIPKKIVTSIVAPTLTRDRQNLICITTINSDNSVMDSFTKAKYEDGSDVMLVLDCQLVCSMCKRQGRASTCKHLMSELPHWASRKQHKKLEAMMKASQADYTREVLGYDISENCQPAFSIDSINVLQQREFRTRASLCTNVRPGDLDIYIMVDPACGGSRSAFAVVSCVYTRRRGEMATMMTVSF